MANTVSKSAIYQACLDRQNELINNFSGEIEEMEENMYNRDNTPSQSDRNEAAEQLTMLNELKKELDFLKYEMKILKGLDIEKERKIVEPGSVVVTDKRTFFVCVSIEEVEADGKKVFGLSTEAPIYSAMKGKKKGDKFDMNGIDYTIEEVY